MAKKKSPKTANKEQEGFGVDPKWKKKPADQTMDGLGISFEEAMKVLSNPTPKEKPN